MTTRAVIVDDTDDARIEYEGSSWLNYENTVTDFGRFGTPVGQTLHGTHTSGGISFVFTGTATQVWGPNDLNTNVTWACSIDGNAISNGDVSVNAAILCSKDQLADKPHTLRLDAVVPDTDHIFWFDHIQYTPSLGESMENETIYIDSSDPWLDYGSGWSPMFDMGHTTEQTGATFDFEFIGISLAWYTFIAPSFSSNPTSASYTIDGGTPVVLTVTGPSGMEVLSTSFNQKLFQTPDLPMGRHKLSVVYHGNDHTAPLSLGYLVVQNGTGSIPDLSNADGVRTPKKRNVGAIVGGVLSGLVFIIVLVLGFRFIQKRKRQRQIRRHRKKYSNLERDMKFLR
ncbi:hypothetical protein CPB83DRAFT_797422 [Crepidotus variabilis]|uniref:Uncharacterized protein n=1 Tax=Crepidotus variabilis TaxID=179855 RepID=A0A9P6JLE4_9AGAR|nr:hypothetical protein CPB83DRAFT_797422 [Crepidotus variabilis]